MQHPRMSAWLMLWHAGSLSASQPDFLALRNWTDCGHANCGGWLTETHLTGHNNTAVNTG
jgi:hypothetical protein